MVMIHFIWTDEPLPQWAQRNIDEFARLNPDHEIVVHSTDAMLLTKYRATYDASAIHMQRSDWLRASILEQLGGWYFDCDCWPLKSLPEMSVGNKLACLCWCDGCLNAMMYCEPGCPVWSHYEPSSPCDKYSGTHALNTIYRERPELFYPLEESEWTGRRLDGINYDMAQLGMPFNAPESQFVIHGT
jgi:hypothetical protein